jgi:hypothetical protein
MITRIILFIFCGCSFWGCLFRDREPGRIRGIRITGKMPVVTPDSVFISTNHYDIFYQGKMMLYRFRYRFDSLTDGRRLISEWRSFCFALDRDSLFGRVYGEVGGQGKRECSDSVFARNCYEPFSFDKFLPQRPDTVKNIGDGEIDVYCVGGFAGDPEKFVYYLYFSKEFAGLEENFFSRSGRAKGGMKLFSIRIIARGAYYPQLNVSFPAREIIYETTVLPDGEDRAVASYFDRYRVEAGKN